MKLGKYIKKLKAIEKRYGSDLKVIHYIDTNCTMLNEIEFDPSIASFNMNTGSCYFDDEIKVNDVKINSVCLK